MTTLLGATTATTRAATSAAKTAAAAMACLFTFGVAQAASPYSGVYVFGDSLSDIGRVFQLTGGTVPDPALGYDDGRFSNGPVAVEWMTTSLTGAALTLAHDYAHGGARTGVSPYSGFDNNYGQLNGTGLLAQTGMFRSDLGGARADPNSLYVVWAGANDFTELPVLANAGGTEWSRVIGNVQTAIDNLAADGARHFLVPNMPNLGLTPSALATGPGGSAQASALTAGYNASFASSLASFDAGRSDIDIRTFDVYGFMTGILAQVEAGGYRGITNGTEPCLGNPACTDPDTFFFWDSLHPTARSHELLGVALAAAVPEVQTAALMLLGIGVVGVVLRRARPDRRR